MLSRSRPQRRRRMPSWMGQVSRPGGCGLRRGAGGPWAAPRQRPAGGATGQDLGAAAGRNPSPRPQGPHHSPFLMAASGPSLREGSESWEDGGREAAGASGRVEAPGSKAGRSQPGCLGRGPVGGLEVGRVCGRLAKTVALRQWPQEGCGAIAFTPKSHQSDSSHIASFIFIGYPTTL